MNEQLKKIVALNLSFLMLFMLVSVSCAGDTIPE
jgi:hypothetical protein